MVGFAFAFGQPLVDDLQNGTNVQETVSQGLCLVNVLFPDACLIHKPDAYARFPIFPGIRYSSAKIATNTILDAANGLRVMSYLI